ncbi:MAG: APC family permease [Clostridia bacterium]|nr:APC family permease [Clostridia bacterium]
MQSKLKEKYGLITAIAMVVGIVIGSGVFFKAEKVLTATGGNLPLGITAWALGGIIMVICAYTFSILATRYSNVNGVVDYAENMLGKRYGYYLNWYLTFLYYPAMTSVLAWVSARYLGVILGLDITGGSVMVIAGLFLVLSFAMNALSPVLAGKFQVSTTVIKLIPLLLMGVIGSIVGLSNGMIKENFTTVVEVVEGGNIKALFTALIATVFAYEGWIIATSINAELKNAKRNLPIALVVGTLIIVAVYILYYIGLAGGITNAEMMAGGESGAKTAFTNIFGNIAGVGIFVLVVISCLGTLNGLMLASTRGMYSIAVRNCGLKPKLFRQVDKISNMPVNSSVVGLVICAFFLVYFYGANLADPLWFGKYGFDSSEIPIVTIYAMYVPIFISMIIKEKSLSFFKRFIVPVVAMIACIFMVYAAIIAHGMDTVYYLIVFAIVMVAAIPFYRKEEVSEE